MSNSKQKVQSNETFGYWKYIEYGVSQRSILNQLLFNIHLWIFFFFFGDLDIVSYADDKESIINTLEALLQLQKSPSFKF